MPVRVLTAASAVALALLAAACRSEPSPAGLVPVFAAQLERAASDWNGGNLDGFMTDYARDTLTGFLSKGRVQRGYDWIREHYAPRFREGARRDSLRFEDVEARPLGAEHALLTARYILYRGDSTTSSGPFTLVMQRQPDGWKSLHDHTSSAPR
jgi:ketosteroid isomerase-like protein